MDRPYAFHTPSQITGDKIIRMVLSPVDLMPNVAGHLGELLNPDAWDETGVSIDETIKEVQNMVDFFYSNPLVGMVASFVGIIPIGWVALDGSTLLQSDYPELTAVVPSLWLSGGDINLPDIADSFVVGAGNLYDLGTEGGETNHVLTTDELPGHSHTYDKASPNIDIEAPGAPDFFALGEPHSMVSTSVVGNDEGHNNVPPFLALNIAIFTGREYA